MMWSGDKAWRQSGERRMLCGLQLPGPNNTQLAFQGKVADVDQSKVWPAGTCLGIDPSTNQPTDIPVDCAGPHAMEVTGAVNVAEKFPDGLPPDPEQDAFIKDACTRMTDAYLAPIQLRSTTLTLIYSTISLPSWSAGSHQVSCSIGATLGNGGWSTLLNSAKGPLQINGQPPIPPPDIPEERLNFPPIPMPDIVVVGRAEQQPERLQPVDRSHDPADPADAADPARAAVAGTHRDPGTADLDGAAGTQQGNTFLNGPPPPARRHRRPGEAPPPPPVRAAACRTRRPPPADAAPPPAPGAPPRRLRRPAAAPGPSNPSCHAATAWGVVRWPCG